VTSGTTTYLARVLGEIHHRPGAWSIRLTVLKQFDLRHGRAITR
jgi:hypothetical protein